MSLWKLGKLLDISYFQEILREKNNFFCKLIVLFYNFTLIKRVQLIFMTITKLSSNLFAIMCYFGKRGRFLFSKCIQR